MKDQANNCEQRDRQKRILLTIVDGIFYLSCAVLAVIIIGVAQTFVVAL